MNTGTTPREVYKYKTSIVPRGCQYYGLPGEEHDQALMSTKFPNTRGMFLTNSLRNVIDSSMNFTEYPLHMLFDIKGKDQIMKLIEHCRIENNWGISSFFDNTLREILFMDYLLTQRRRIVEYNIATHMHCNWFTTNVYTVYAKDEISVLSIQQLMIDVNLASENRYPRDPFFVEY